MSTARSYEDARALAREIADRMEWLLGRRPSITWLEQGGLHVSVKLGPATARDPVLGLKALDPLNMGDRFGHRCSDLPERPNYVWTQVDFVGPSGSTETEEGTL
ncbi:hypothetical protein [Kitasatospora sp. McL0602]|uniref:hypothetical protein n=1 Tax=Kitasatospora sp. McL0602 TaxID=3439530 RepID=UPI003F8AE79B